MKLPTWLKHNLKNKHIQELLISMNSIVTDGAVQQVYEYIRELEEK